MTTNSTKQQAQPQTGPIAQQLAKIQANGQQPSAGQSKKRIPKWTGFAGKTLWDWLQLLIIPFILAIGGFWFNAQQNQIGLQMSERQHINDLAIASYQQQETTLRTCMDDVKDLLLNRGLKTSKQSDEVRAMAKVEVFSTLRQLDGEHKGALMYFLSEAGLITNTHGSIDVIIDLTSGNLANANLSHIFMQGAQMSGSNLSHANLADTTLTSAELFNANLSGADLRGAIFLHADLNDADLQGARLGVTDMRFANLENADLRGVDLSHTILREANLKDAQVTKEQLAKAWSLKGAIMPDGSIHP